MDDSAAWPLMDDLLRAIWQPSLFGDRRRPKNRPMIRIGTLCYVVGSCRASPASRCAVGKIVEVVS
jgi:hypothetical protein